MSTSQAKRTEGDAHVRTLPDTDGMKQMVLVRINNATIAQCGGCNAEANAAHLALCWNSHADLVEAE